MINNFAFIPTHDFLTLKVHKMHFAFLKRLKGNVARGSCMGTTLTTDGIHGIGTTALMWGMTRELEKVLYIFYAIKLILKV